jgi:XRE family transcriptional regulator, fatty acid utilization regulator
LGAFAKLRKYRQAIEQGAALSARLGEDRQAVMATLPSTPFEEVRDFFYLHHNYIEELDEAAEAIAVRMHFRSARWRRRFRPILKITMA